MSVHLGLGGRELRFGRLFGIPIHFTPWYLAFALFVLVRAGFTWMGVLWLAVLTFSVLVHELGHGLMAVRYRLGAKIVISAFGGWCEHDQASRRQHDFHVVAAGPLAGLALALVSWVLYELTATLVPPIVSTVFWMSASANLFWSLFNAIPVYSLDGGRMLQVGLGWVTSNRRADGITWWTGTVVGALLALSGALSGSIFIAFLAGSMAFQNYQRAQPHNLRRTFFPDKNPARATPGGLGLGISRTLWWVAIATAVLWLGGYLSRGYGGWAAELALQPNRLLAGESLWAALTYPWIFAPGDWAPMLLAVLAVLVCGPAVQRRMGTRALVAMLGVAALAGAASAAALPLVVASLARSTVSGSGAVAMALLVAWAAIVPREVVGLGPVRITARFLAFAVVLLDVGAVMAGLVTWHLALHAGGLVVGLGAALVLGAQSRLARNPLADPPPIDLSFTQGAQQQDDVWH